ncbi:hypothetical protein BABINDRAFT_169674 [Babjeviella inositovora NRRL Y-12698]|uniref:CUE domain-containing protein n=1 Tax=Babjeviella inositovora NRRL Y-12698 TaxID=984486 RepID=A0A1E3QX74_9ASCO|nr:uncharacterized protein BABINDRAFT_169674 [Babjeviella inositovora NRRL Y-12698]ODQ82283.1 hypothetical protein BABINDRAFT_169674 [Babjeviella inositovora NRRL Y-12698]
MDNSTVTFILTLVVAFIFLRWFISPDLPQQSVKKGAVKAKKAKRTKAVNEEGVEEESSDEEFDIHSPMNNVKARAVSSSMIEVVQTLAPQLTEAQIRWDLENNGGSVSLTVDKFMETGSLPFPPDTAPQAATASRSGDEVAGDGANVAKRSGLEKAKSEELTPSTTGWSDDKQERSKLLQKKREEMVDKARKRLAAQLDGA